jgi:hypothetical protein
MAFTLERDEGGAAVLIRGRVIGDVTEADVSNSPCMQYTLTKLTTTVKKWATVLAVVGMAGATTISAGQADQADAKRLLKAMSDYLAAQKAISFDYDVDLELVSTQQQKIALASSGALTLNRPDKLHLTRTGGFANLRWPLTRKR